jgi:hypothetical protein
MTFGYPSGRSHIVLTSRPLEHQGVFEAAKVLPMALEHPIRLHQPLMEVPQAGGRFLQHPHLDGDFVLVSQ